MWKSSDLAFHCSATLTNIPYVICKKLLLPYLILLNLDQILTGVQSFTEQLSGFKFHSNV